jgi:hypothetical protein
MKKIILLLVMAMFAAPAMAIVTIDVVDLGDGWAALDYNCTGNNAVGFGLNVSVSAGNIIGVNILHVGENDGNGVGFGIFPASFDRFIDPNDPNWNVANYTPVADAGDEGAAGGLPGPAITIELGALGLDAPNDGRLIEIQVDASCTMTVSNNSSRGGVVLKGGGPGGFPGAVGEISLCCPGDSDANDVYNLVDYYAMQGNLAYADYIYSGGAGTSYHIFPDDTNDPNANFLFNACEDWDSDGDVAIDDYYDLQGALAYADYIYTGGAGTDYRVEPDDPCDPNANFLWQCP